MRSKGMTTATTNKLHQSNAPYFLTFCEFRQHSSITQVKRKINREWGKEFCESCALNC
jgi:hypothetical protein